MRFSLGTLLLVVLWLGALVLVWIQREAWVRYTPTSVEGIGDPLSFAAPDGRRRIEIRHIDEHPDCVAIIEDTGEFEGRVLWEFEGNAAFGGFLDNDHFWFDDYQHIRVYRRRHPEWWWGHFYRPEVWIVLMMTAALIYRIFLKFKRRRIEK